MKTTRTVRCRYCGVLFTVGNAARKYCSEACFKATVFEQTAVNRAAAKFTSAQSAACRIVRLLHQCDRFDNAGRLTFTRFTRADFGGVAAIYCDFSAPATLGGDYVD